MLNDTLCLTGDVEYRVIALILKRLGGRVGTGREISSVA